MKTYRFKLYKTKKQKDLHRRVRVAGEIYNHLIALHKRYYRLTGKYISKRKMQNHLPKLKRYSRFSHWKIVGSQAIQNIALRIDFGYQKFFKHENKRPPSFRKMRKFRSFTLTQAGWTLNDDHSVKIGRKTYKFWKSQDIKGKPKLIHVVRDTLGDFYMCIVTDFEENKPDYVASSETVGMDFGLKTYFTLSDGIEIESPLFFKQDSKELAKANRSLSRKAKDSKNRSKARRNLARLHKKIAARRRDWQEKEARNLAHKYAAIFVEDLNINGMKALWGRKVSDLAFYQQVQILKRQCGKTGAIFGKVDRWFPSTKMCCKCGTLHDMPLEKRWMRCDCGNDMSRDENAAINIKNAGMSALGLGAIRGGSLPCAA